MKTTLLVLCVLMTTAAFGQLYGGGLNSQVQVFHAAEHPGHAGYTSMAQETSVVGGGGYTIAQGERPTWDFPQAPQKSLGEAARELKKQHDVARKSRVVWVNQ
jgi:hypothetical protein